MTILELRAAHPELFNMKQDWFVDEDFAKTPRRIKEGAAVPRKVVYIEKHQQYADVTAVSLLMGYVQCPSLLVWERYLWTLDIDHLGQQVYIGKNSGLMEIHRHIHITERFGVPACI